MSRTEHRTATLAVVLLACCGCAEAGDESSAPPSAPRARDPRETVDVDSWALLVGCTKYPNLAERFQLRGPGNDVQLLRGLLRDQFGFSDEGIVVLAESEPYETHRPTRANIAREFAELARHVTKGDRVVILLAGHGSQQPDDGRTEDPEPDGLDEVFLPSDVGAWNGEQHGVENAVTDDELCEWLAAILARDAHVLVLADACHSGSIVRGTDEERTRKVPAEILVPEDVLANALTESRGGDSETVFDADRVRGEFVALYASQSTEPTVEKRLPRGGERWHGLLTYTVCRELLRTRSPITYRELAQRVRLEYTRTGRTFPTPLVEGPALDRLVLGDDSYSGRSAVQLFGDDDGFTVDHGALHGLTTGSILAVFPMAGTANADERLGHVRVTAVEPTTARVEPCAYGDVPVPAELPAAGRCELVLHDLGDVRLELGVDETGLADLPPGTAARVERVLTSLSERRESLVRRVPVASADWVLRSIEGELHAVPTEGVVRDEFHRNGLAFGPIPVDERGLSEWLANRPRRVARVRNLLRLVDPEPSPGTDAIAVSLELIRFTGDMERDEVVPFGAGGRLVHAGDQVTFRVRNESPVAVDVSLLFVDSQYGITAFFPRRFRVEDNRIPPRGELVSRRVRVNAKTVGWERMVVIATPGRGQPLDFSALEQPTIEATRSGEGDLPRFLREETLAESPLSRLLRSAMYGTGVVRGLEETEAERFAIDCIEWRVVADQRQRPAETKAAQ